MSHSVFSASILLVWLVLTTGCVQTRPLVSHAHIGHAVTTWHDTPAQEGLFSVAKQELDIAVAAVEQALIDVADPVRAERHLSDALNALNPDRQPLGTGLGYGAIRALTGAVEHLEYAASSTDASDNLVGAIVVLADQGDAVVSRMTAAEQRIQTFQAGSGNAVSAIEETRNLLLAAKYGVGGNATTLAHDNLGLVQITESLDEMLHRETDPVYEPVPVKYVLGLVRLPSGTWAYRLPRQGRPMSGRPYGY